MRKIISAYRTSSLYIIKVRYRLIKRIRFKATRLLVFLFFRLWIKEVSGFDNVPAQGPALLVSNHLSYYDFLILGCLFRQQIVFLAVKKISQTFFVRWFTKMHIVVYVDRDRPGSTFFREVLRHLEAGKLVVIYPEGTRSRTGKMLKPKPGFVKLAMVANLPIIPIAMKGTYEILPPHKHIPRLTKCKVIVGKRMYVSPENPVFSDVFFQHRGDRKFRNLTAEQMQEVAIRIMDKVRMLAEEDWDDSFVEMKEQAETEVTAEVKS